ncbi:MAG: hypothetical protein GF315_01375 [candidate division Zixibacteria bacterium]|nr:hypothetical protein [candidate division Zixibacteria bacterium]
MKNAITLTLILIIGIVASANAEQTFSPFRHDIYALGMGDAFVASGENANAFLYNPALLSKIRGIKVAVDAQLYVNREFKTVVDYMYDNQDHFENWDDLSPTERDELVTGMQDFDDRWVAVGGSPALSVVLPMGVGFALYNNASMKVRLDRGIFEPKGYADLYNDMVFAGGYSRQVMPKLSVGGNLKYISRRVSGEVKLLASEFGKADDIFEEVEDSLESSKSGFGLDVGGLYTLTPNIDLGASIIDLIGTVDGDKTPVYFRVGGAYHYSGGFVTNSFLREVVLACDIDDMFNQDGDHLFNKMHLGADFRMPIVSFRFGFNQGYPGLGVGFNFKFVKLDYAYVGNELGSAPGRESNYSHYAQLAFGWM